MDSVVYVLCAITSLVCAVLLYRAHQRKPSRILLWGSLCFVGLTLNNILLVIDLSVIPEGPDLSSIRNVTILISLSVFLYGLIWDAV